MARDSQITDGLHMVKLRVAGENASVTVPKEIRELVGVEAGCFLAVRAIGPCVVICQITDVSADGAQRQADDAFEKAIATIPEHKR